MEANRPIVQSSGWFLGSLHVNSDTFPPNHKVCVFYCRHEAALLLSSDLLYCTALAHLLHLVRFVQNRRAHLEQMTKFGKSNKSRRR